MSLKSPDNKTWIEELRHELPPLMTYSDVTNLLGIAPRTVYEMLERHPGMCVKPTPNRYRIIRDRFLEWLAAGGEQKNEDGEAA